MAETILEKESVVDYWISTNPENHTHYFLSFDQCIIVNLINHHYETRIINSAKNKKGICIRIAFEKPELIEAHELELILYLKEGELDKLLREAKESDIKKAEARCLSVKLDIEKEVSMIKESRTNAMVFYERTELAHTLLRRAINAYSNILHRAEYRKDADTLKMDLDTVKKNKDIALETLRNASFDSLDEMNYIIDTYSTIVKELYRA
ncbi:hypothetical protein [Chitinophaga sp. sic0106]|uniref:hypothetical protein n=1 Tax=Chitinophaga sp. sic0106 TaxID=2854785 RepID=UPI001C496FAB|nr:hypothetical protein [Chitinophaga sp. sic0106]MBV7533317.1 hypothetical protein [Chitinophaga sp. sic0106]